MSIDALAQTINDLDAHDIYNPDDESNLLNGEFLSVTDDRTRQLIEQIIELSKDVLFKPDGSPNRRAITALRQRGINLSEAGSPYPNDPYETCVLIKIEEGYIQATSVQLGV
ncbi:hypothetical protein [Modicisalibacter xianhensis]|uniref:Uncharacterized protein n=1 Tax=Modicisalibacter xianhensis TaxID=442341 RepID=A0A1I3EN29_9GAMM|nr:hypothetical protein [Halomonas xianhensis]SFI00230.1 hypothetical protein SAMN04487959_11458 [Halomonas xianhensis]